MSTGSSGRTRSLRSESRIDYSHASSRRTLAQKSNFALRHWFCLIKVARATPRGSPSSRVCATKRLARGSALQILGMHRHVADQKQRPALRIRCMRHQRSKRKAGILGRKRRWPSGLHGNPHRLSDGCTTKVPSFLIVLADRFIIHARPRAADRVVCLHPVVHLESPAAQVLSNLRGESPSGRRRRRGVQESMLPRVQRSLSTPPRRRR
jgi:hypothetical protein